MLRPSLLLVLMVAPVPPLAAQGVSLLNLVEPQGRLQPGEGAEGALSAADYVGLRGEFVDIWGLEGRAGQRVTIDLISETFDSYLVLVGPGFAQPVTDDDGGGGCNARIAVTLLEHGEFRVAATSRGIENTGVYTLRLYDGDGPPAPTYSCGGFDPAMLAALPTEDRTISVGATFEGRLTGEETTASDQPLLAWTLQGRAGEAVTILLRSDDFDPYLLVIGPGMDEVESDDDGAGDLDSRLAFTFPEDGTYRVIVSAVTIGARGAFQLVVARSDAVDDLRNLPTDGRSLSVGIPATGTLSSATMYDGRVVEAWALEGTAGQQITISMISDEFDTYLFLVGPGIMTPLSDDDGGEGVNAQLSTTLPAAGSYRVVASSYRGGGAYRLSVTSP